MTAKSDTYQNLFIPKFTRFATYLDWDQACYVIIFKCANKKNRTQEYGRYQNKNYVGGETCWSSNWLFNQKPGVILFRRNLVRLIASQSELSVNTTEESQTTGLRSIHIDKYEKRYFWQNMKNILLCLFINKNNIF